MENNTKKICPICNEEIKENDIVTMCENCKTLYHQSCWNQNKGCSDLKCNQHTTNEKPIDSEIIFEKVESANEEKFNSNEESLMIEPYPKKEFCTNCGSLIDNNQNFCSSCGKSVKSNANDKYNNASNGNIKNTKSKKKIPLIIGGVVITIALLSLVTVFNFKKNNFSEMFKDISTEYWCKISEDGSYMEIDTNPYDLEDEFVIDAHYEIMKINEKLGFSSSLSNKMGKTSSLDGRQTESNEIATASWKYHPDTGLEVMYEWND